MDGEIPGPRYHHGDQSGLGIKAGDQGSPGLMDEIPLPGIQEAIGDQSSPGNQHGDQSGPGLHIGDASCPGLVAE